MNFTPMQYGNVKNYFKSECGKFVIAKTTFGWIAYTGFGTAEQKLLTNAQSKNSKTGAIADCMAV